MSNLVSYRFEKGATGVGLPQFEAPFEPRLAERWEVSTDGKKITYFLPKGIKSEYGNEFTAEDVKWGVVQNRRFLGNTDASERPGFEAGFRSAGCRVREAGQPPQITLAGG